MILALAGCAAAQERSDQQEAVQYTIIQHDAARCADAGFLPGSAPFNDCMAKLESSTK
jgi:hypothetical protein